LAKQNLVVDARLFDYCHFTYFIYHYRRHDYCAFRLYFILTKVKKIIIFITSFFLALLMAELAFRLFDWPPYEMAQSVKGMYQADDELGMILNPGWEGFISDLEYKTRIKINSDGIRDNEHQPDSSQKKIVVVGDSFAFGLGVDFEDTFSAVLEKKVRDVEVIKAGISSYGAKQSLLMAKRMSDKYQPEIILFAFYEGNDFGDDVRFSHFHTVKDGYVVLWDNRNEEIPAIEPQRNLANKKWLGKIEFLHKSRLYRFLRFKAIQLGIVANPFLTSEVSQDKGQKKYCPWPIYMQFVTPGFPNNNEISQQQWQLTQEVFLEAQEYALAHGIELIVLIIPDKLQADDKLWQFLVSHCKNFENEDKFDRFNANQLLREFFNENDIQYIDFLPVFRAYKNSGKSYYQKDPHLTKVGHQVVAETVYQYLLMRGRVEN
jgi:hypothetical protein